MLFISKDQTNPKRKADRGQAEMGNTGKQEQYGLGKVKVVDQNTRIRHTNGCLAKRITHNASQHRTDTKKLKQVHEHRNTLKTGVKT